MAFSLMLVLSCVLQKNNNSQNVIVTDNGLLSKGTGISQIERTSRSIAIRMARNELIKYLNLVLSKIDLDYHIPKGTHTESELKDTKVIEIKQTTHKGNITTNAWVEWSNQNINVWAELYYELLPKDDLLKTQIKENEFIRLIINYSQINYSL